MAVKGQLRRLETLGRPVVAAMNGTALGGGLEIGLACHHRIGLDAKGVVYGLPEVTLGLLPGGGGVVRITRMLGIADGFMKVLAQGQRHKPAAALEIGIVDELAATPEEMLDKARAWIAANPDAAQPWDQPGYRIPGGTPSTPKLAAVLPAFPANLRKQLKGAPMPAPRNILAAAVEGAQVDIDTAFRIEARYFTELVTGQVSKNMTKAFFFDLQHINGGGSRPDGFEKLAAAQGRGARRRDDGRRHRLHVRAVGLGGRAQGRLAGGGREGQGLLRGAGREGRQAREDHAGEGRGAAGADHADRRLQRPRRLRHRHRGGVRVGGAQAGGVPGGDEDRRAGRAALLQHLHAADHRARRRASTARATSSACTSSRPSTRCRWWRSSAGSAPSTPRWPRRST